ncbi:hypothetical protein ACFVS2_25475 [Brevibacillus sp. NPDC058079]|uniref:hypothetical protein n=1 Tax=Brevibacillus sp. NPDC058079 TaxID=3346330 RepID=UPI0036E97B00
MAQPTLMVLATLEWHYGIPNGDHKVSLVIPEFDVEDLDEKIRAGREALIQYGCPENEILYNKDHLYHDLTYTALIGEYHRVYPPGFKAQAQVCEVTASFCYVWVHRGKVYSELKQVDTFVVHHQKTSNAVE